MATVVDLVRRGHCALVVNTPFGGSGRPVRRLSDPRGGARRACPVHHDDCRSASGRSRNCGSAGRPRRIPAGAHQCAAALGLRVLASEGGRSLHAAPPRAWEPRARRAGPVLHARGAWTAPAEADEPCTAPAGSSFLLEAIGPEHGRSVRARRASTSASSGRSGTGSGSTWSGRSRRRRDRDRAASVPGRDARRSAPCCSAFAARARRSRCPTAERRCRRRAHVRHRAAGRTRRGPRRPRVRPGTDARSCSSPGAGAQLAWEAPMACGYGACYGCSVEIDGVLKRLCVEGPSPGGGDDPERLRLFDALEARPRSRVARRVRHQDGDAAAAAREPPVRIAETEHGMLNSIGLENPGIEALLAEKLPRLAELGVPIWVSVGGSPRPTTPRLCAALDERDEVDGDRAQPLVPERRRGARERRRDRRGLPVAPPKPLYAKLSPASSRTSRRSARAVQAGRRRALAREHDPRARPRRGRSEPMLGTETGGYSGPALKPIALAAVFRCYRATGLPIVGMGGVPTGRDALELIAAGASMSLWGRFSSPTPTLPRGSSRARPSLPLGAWRNRRMRAAMAHPRGTGRSCCLDQKSTGISAQNRSIARLSQGD